METRKEIHMVIPDKRPKNVLLAKVTDVESKFYLKKGKVTRCHFGNILVKFPEVDQALAYNKDDVEVFMYEIPEGDTSEGLDKLEVTEDQSIISSASLL
jgi:hypothetical protein